MKDLRPEIVWTASDRWRRAPARCDCGRLAAVGWHPSPEHGVSVRCPDAARHPRGKEDQGERRHRSRHHQGREMDYQDRLAELRDSHCRQRQDPRRHQQRDPARSQAGGRPGRIDVLRREGWQFLWQLVVPKLGAGKVSDWEYVGICSSAAIEEDRCCVMTNRGEVVCLDMDGMANGNDGHARTRGRTWRSSARLRSRSASWMPTSSGRTTCAQNSVCSRTTSRRAARCIAAGKLFITTSNGVDWSHTNIPAPPGAGADRARQEPGSCSVRRAPESGRTSCTATGRARPTARSRASRRSSSRLATASATLSIQRRKEDEEGFLIFPEIWQYDCNLPGVPQQRGRRPDQVCHLQGPERMHRDHRWSTTARSTSASARTRSTARASGA